jgi:actin-related protein
MGSETAVVTKKPPAKEAGKTATATAASTQAKSNRVTSKDTTSPACVVVDNGGWTVKYGLVPPINQNNNGPGSQIMSTMYNATARPPHQLTVLTGDEITKRMKNLGQLTWNNSMERGMICDGETQLRVWARTLEVSGVVPTPQIKGGGFLTLQGASAAKRRGNAAAAAAASVVDASSASSNASIPKYSSNNCTFLLLEPPHVPSVISEGVDCILFRELGVGRVARMLGPCMAAVKYLSIGKKSTDSNEIATTTKSEWLNDDTNCCCVIDSGYSFTHVVPTHRGGAMTKAIRRLDIGGKVLTNLLKEAVTYRQWNMMDEYHIVNDAKEQLSFVSDKFDSEMKQAHVTRKGLRWFDREYLLPDFVSSSRGTVRLPAPLQRKREMEKMEEKKLELERKKKEEEENKVSDEEDEGNDQQIDDDAAEAAVDMDVDDTSAKKKQNPDSKRQRKEKGKKKAKKRSKKRKHDSKQNDDDDEVDMSDGEDSDEESDEQRLKRLKVMRDEERKRREREERERQALAMSVERFAIPEVLFRPSDIGMNCGGIVEAIVESINACDDIYRAAMYNNVLLVGGNATIPGFRERVESELRKLAPTNYPVRVYLPDDPVSFAWEGAVQFSQQDGFQKQFSIDRVSWEAMKKAGKDQSGIWGERMNNIVRK